MATEDAAKGFGPLCKLLIPHPDYSHRQRTVSNQGENHDSIHDMSAESRNTLSGRKQVERWPEREQELNPRPSLVEQHVYDFRLWIERTQPSDFPSMAV
jgi:hypothetical protein